MVRRIRLDQLMIRKGLAKSNKEVNDILKEGQSSIPIGRLATVEEFANYVSFLSSDNASYITGTILNVDGGLSKATF